MGGRGVQVAGATDGNPRGWSGAWRWLEEAKRGQKGYIYIALAAPTFACEQPKRGSGNGIPTGA